MWSCPRKCHAHPGRVYYNSSEQVFVLFYEILRDQDILEEVPPWNSPMVLKPVYKSEQVEAWWDVPVYADHQEVRANRVDPMFVNHMSKELPMDQ